MTDEGPGPRRRVDLTDMGHLDFVEGVFLEEARARGCLTGGQDIVLSELVTQLRAEAAGVTADGFARASGQRAAASSGTTVAVAPPSTAVQSTAVQSTAVEPTMLDEMLARVDASSPSATTPSLRGGPPTRPVAPARPKPPSAFALWWGRTRQAVGSDLAVHGLAYLGVLLFFVGAFGLVAFAFGDVAPALRPVAESVIALAPFAAGALLRRRGATVVGRALEVAGGLLLPVMVITTFLDGVAFPPDLEGPALAVTLTVLMVLVAVGYAVWSRRYPDSALRFLVAPVGWLAVAMATLGVGREMPVGREVATPSSAQCAAMLGALVATAAWARLRPRARLAGPTTAVTPPGLAVISALAVLSWIAEGWPGIPVLLSGAFVLVALEIVADRLSPALLGLIEPLWWTLVVVGLAQDSVALPGGEGAVAALAAVGFVGILDVAGSARRTGLALALPALGAVLSLSATWVEPWWAVASLGIAAVWTALRRITPFDVPAAAAALDVATAALPVAAVAALALATDVPTAALAGAALVLLATVPARGQLLDRSLGDPYWARWWAGACALVALVALAAWESLPGLSVREEWLLAATLVLLSVSSAFGPMDRRVRPPVVTALASATWVVAAGAAAATQAVVVTSLGVVGLALVIAAHVPSRTTRRVHLASLGLTGHALGAATLLMALGTEWALVAATVLATAGWCVTGWLDSKDRSVVGSAFATVHPPLRWVPLTIAALGLPASLSLVLDRSGLLPWSNPWSVTVLAGMALAYAALTRLSVPGRVVVTAAWAGFVGSVVAAVVGAVALGTSVAVAGGVGSSRLPAAVSVAAVSAAVALIRARQRHPVMIWTAWLALTPLAGLLALEFSGWFASLAASPATAVCLGAVGAVLLVSGAAADLRGRSWTPVIVPIHAWARPPVMLGAGQLAVSIALAAAVVTTDVSGWVFGGAAVAVIMTAALSRAGILGGAAVLLGWSSVLALAISSIESKPWIAVVTAFALLLAAEGLSRLPGEAVWWQRWDAPLLVAAGPVALTALVAASGGPASAVTFAMVGGESIAVATRLRRIVAVAVALGAVGAALVLWGAVIAGPGWLALALLCLSASLSALAPVVSSAELRLTLQIGGALAALGAWRVGSDWLMLTDQRAVDIAAVGAGVLAAAAGVAAWRPLLPRSWVLVWGGMAVAVEAVCAWDVVAVAGLLRDDVAPSWPVAAGLIIVALALAGVAPVVGIGWLRDVSVPFGLASVWVGLRVTGASTPAVVLILLTLSVVSAGAIVAASRRVSMGPWRRPLILLGTLTTLSAILVAGLSDTGLLVPALAVAAIQAAACGVALHRVLLQMAAPVLALSAWIVFSLDALDGNPQWMTVPTGLAILAVVALWRRDRQERGGDVAATEIVVLELVGVGFLVGSAWVQTFTETLAYAALAATIGLAVVGWGVVTRVRRRVAAGAVIIAVSVVLLIGVPLVGLLPSWQGAGLWVLIGGLGLIAVLIASMLERGKAVARKTMTRLAEATAGWE
ncbi:hypothetical protein GCM10009826_14580 [Humibacillus xanthopallidus]